MERHEIEDDIEETPDDDDWVGKLCMRELDATIVNILEFTVADVRRPGVPKWVM